MIRCACCPGAVRQICSNHPPSSVPPISLIGVYAALYTNKCVDQGNEGVDVKEGCLDTVIENNNISMQHDENAGGMLAAYRCLDCRYMPVFIAPPRICSGCPHARKAPLSSGVVDFTDT